MQTENLFQCFMDGVHERVYFKDTECRFIRANQALADHLGVHNPADLIGKTDFDFHSDDHAREAFADEQEIIRSGQPLKNKEERESWRDREDTWVSTCKMPLRDPTGKVIGIFGISRDITERKRAQDRIYEQARLIDLVPDAILVLDLDGKIRHWNEGAAKIYGWNAEEIMGRPYVAMLHPQVNCLQFAELLSVTQKSGEWSGEMEELSKERMPIFVQSRASLMKDSRGQAKAILLVNTDITEKKRLETQMLRSQRMESLGTLASGIAHDLNNIFSPLLIAVHLLQDRMIDKEDQHLLLALDSCVQRGAKLIKQVLAFTRGIKGERVPVVIDQLVNEIGQIIRETFPKSIEFESDCSAGLPTVTGDATQLHQVLLNLCVNARDAMPNGGRLTVRVERAELDAIYTRKNLDASVGRYVVIKVADTGIGISKIVQERMFEPFFTTKEQDKGTGLGLATCQGIVKSHGGFINCYSELGNGTVFKIYLPVADTPLGHKASIQEPFRSAATGHGELVLLVDDDEDVREVARMMLERFGYRVLTAVNGAEGVAIYQQHLTKIGAVVIDMAMPVMDGPAAIVALKSINPQIKIIGVSGLDVPGGKADKAVHECMHFLSKPYTADSLIRMINAALSAS